MRKITSETWKKISKDYKLIKDNKRYAIIEDSVLEPVEIDEETGQFFAKIIFNVGKNPLYNEAVSCIYDPLQSEDENFKRILKKVIHYKDDYKYFIDNNLYNIIEIKHLF